MSVQHEALSVGSLLHDAERQKLVLPNFQRDYVWALDAQRRLIASLLADVPIGAVLLLDGEPDDYASRRLPLTQEATPLPECIYLLDGQQRLSTLAVALASPFRSDQPWKDTFDALPAKLRYAWRIRVAPLQDEQDIFGYNHLSFPDRLDAEPDELANFLAPTRILVNDATSDSAWYHPNWRIHVPQRERSRQIAIAAATDKIVPLWALDRENTLRLVDTTLTLIAGHRRVDLSASPEFNQRPQLYESLRRADPTLPGEWKDATRNQIDQAFSSLAERWRTDMSQFIRATLLRQTPGIRLQREDISRAVAIFEVINQGGTPLTPFDLIVAKHARDPQAASLNQMLLHRLQTAELTVGQAAWMEPGSPPAISKWTIEDRGICVNGDSLTSTFKNSFLNLLSIHYYSGDQPDLLDVAHIKRKAILAVPAKDIKDSWHKIADALLRAWCFLQIRCGIRAEADLRYKLMILPIAYSILRMPKSWDDRTFHDRLECWYWSAMFAGVFRERQNENAIQELKLLYRWLTSDSDATVKITSRQSLVLKVPGYSDKDTLLLKDQDSTITSDVSSALLQYVLSLGPMDFRTDHAERLFAWLPVELEDHHVIPLASATNLRASASELRSRGEDYILNSPLNRTIISKQANRDIGSKTPSQYWSDLNIYQPVSHLLPVIGTAEQLLGGANVEEKARTFLEQRYNRIREKLVTELHQLSG